MLLPDNTNARPTDLERPFRIRIVDFVARWSVGSQLLGLFFRLLFPCGLSLRILLQGRSDGLDGADGCETSRGEHHGEKGSDHSASPRVSAARGRPAVGTASMVRKSSFTSATASGYSTTIATSRRKSRLIAASARPHTTAMRSSMRRILPCALRSPSRLDP